MRSSGIRRIAFPLLAVLWEKKLRSLTLFILFLAHKSLTRNFRQEAPAGNHKHIGHCYVKTAIASKCAESD
ncbi:hypothetical protein B1H58_19515 [Pantoea alhagi]|uniref:Uncharacterized protein n=1 Tax=Pantoea alhagi TaxID=1891675 RepID=A0A1W6BA69_9GAMM|nr:hypothetical protein B1H58_19515 [Pantoea alhagi]